MIQLLQQVARIQSAEGLPRELGNVIVPTLELNPRIIDAIESISNNNSTSGTGTIIAAQAGRKFVITGFTAGVVKDATCDTADGAYTVTYTTGGISKSLFSLPLLTLTAQEQAVSGQFKNSIICDANTAISLSSNTFTAGKMRRHTTIYGYWIDNPDA